MVQATLWGKGAPTKEKSEVLRWEDDWNEKENNRQMIASGGRERKGGYDVRETRGREQYRVLSALVGILSFTLSH